MDTGPWRVARITYWKEIKAMITTHWLADPVPPSKVLESVFACELGDGPEEMHGASDGKTHIALLKDGETAVAAGWMTLRGEEAVIRQIAVLQSCRGEGFGDMLLRLLLFKAQRLNAKQITMYAPISDVEYYKKFGFEGEALSGSNNPYISMRVSAGDVIYPRECDGEASTNN